MKDTQVLMHQNNPVCECKFDKRGYIQDVTQIFNETLLPLCVNPKDSKKDIKIDIQKWILTRNLAVNRKDIEPLRKFYGGEKFVSDTSISLFDSYWFSDKSHTDWDSVNAYDNWDCKKDSLYLMLAHPEKLQEIDGSSPNLTIPGKHQRLWYKSKGELFLLHGNAQQEMGIYKKVKENPYAAERFYTILSGTVYVSRQAETSKDVELINFEDLYNITYNEEFDKMENLVNCCTTFHIPDWENFFECMNEFDKKIENDTRELRDIYCLRDTNTLKILGFSKL